MDDQTKKPDEKRTMSFAEKADLDSELTFMAADADRARLMVVDLLSDHFMADIPTKDTIFGIQIEYERIRTKLEIAEHFLLEVSQRVESITDAYIKDFAR